MTYQRRYSGEGRSGVCTCGCSWDKHHLAVVLNEDYFRDTGEAYIPGECEAFGWNEVGGMKFENEQWVDHCQKYEDSGVTL